jgi:hypothetical protein
VSEDRFDRMTDAEAEAHLNRIWNVVPEVVEAVEASTLIASPLAGPVRVLREVVEVTGWHFTEYVLDKYL